jgi:FKBP-type peptidyl-prolyl cis-trans isomerase
MNARIGSVLFLSLLVLSACDSQGGTPDLNTQEQKAGYALGFQTGTQLQPAESHFDLTAFEAGVRDALAGSEPVVPRGELQTVLTNLSQTVNQEMAEQVAAEREKNQSDSDAKYAENLEKEGVVTTESGLQYEVLRPGDGDIPTASERVSIQYRGTLLDGTQFDSSYEKGGPQTFPVTQFIPGFSEGLQLMPEGSQYRFYIPPQLGYGPQGSPPVIGPNAMLIFEVELLEIVE